MRHPKERQVELAMRIEQHQKGDGEFCTTVGVASLLFGCRVEIDCIARVRRSGARA